MHEPSEKMHESPAYSVELLSGGAHFAAKGQDFPAHKHPNWELVYYRTGHIRCPQGDIEYTSVPGLLLLNPPNTVHSEIARTAYSNYFVQLRVNGRADWPLSVYDDGSLGLQGIFGAIVRELNGSRAFRSEMLDILAKQLQITVRRAHLTTGASPAEVLVFQAESTIEERFRERVQVNAVARELGCSPSALRAYFAVHRQISPHAYLQSVRLRNALAFLRNSSLTVQSVAEQCGFDSASHLSRVVKKATGMSPGQVRKREVG